MMSLERPSTGGRTWFKGGRRFTALGSMTLTVVISCLTVTGCEAGLKPVGMLQPMPPAQGEAIDPIAASELFPLQAQRGVYERQRGDRDNRAYDYELRREGDEWIFEIDERHRIHLIRRDDGAIALRRYENLKRDVQVEAEPAMLMLPARVDDAVHEGYVQLTVHGLLGRRTMRGESHYQLRLAGTREIETPEGTREAYIIEQHQQISMPLARAEVELETAYVAGLGRVMDRLAREHRVLGLFGDDVQESYQRVE